MAEGENAGEPLFFVAREENPVTNQPNTTAPGGNQTGEHEQMKNTDSALYAHIYSEREDWHGASTVWVLAIGKTVPGSSSHGAAQRVGGFSTPAAAVLAATERGVKISRVEVGE